MLMVWAAVHDLTLWCALAVLRDPSLPISRFDMTDEHWSMTSLGVENSWNATSCFGGQVRTELRMVAPSHMWLEELN